MFDMRSGQLLSTLRGHTGNIQSLASLSDGRLVSGAQDSSVRIWQPTTNDVANH